ncbi:Uncharacterised protein [Candidatus Anstonella stagnisolia]|nr:Uncharacterised protein [Candidatus Anstonella stagnisolia]
MPCENTKAMKNMKEEYGSEKGKEVYYAMKNEGKLAKDKTGLRKVLSTKWSKVKAQHMDYEGRKHPVISEKNLSNPIFGEAYKREGVQHGKEAKHAAYSLAKHWKDHKAKYTAQHEDKVPNCPNCGSRFTEQISEMDKGCKCADCGNEFKRNN